MTSCAAAIPETVITQQQLEFRLGCCFFESMNCLGNGLMVTIFGPTVCSNTKYGHA